MISMMHAQRDNLKLQTSSCPQRIKISNLLEDINVSLTHSFKYTFTSEMSVSLCLALQCFGNFYYAWWFDTSWQKQCPLFSCFFFCFFLFKKKLNTTLVQDVNDSKYPSKCYTSLDIWLNSFKEVSWAAQQCPVVWFMAVDCCFYKLNVKLSVNFCHSLC